MEEAAAEPARGDAFRDNPSPSELSSEDAAAGGGAPSVPPEAPPATNAPPDEPPSAPKPPRPLYCGVRMPYFFREDSFELFREMDVREDDIFLSSGVKMGSETTWVTKILNGLKDYDDDGNLKASVDDSLPNRKFQTYPEALPPTREVERRDIAQGKSIVKHFGDFTLDELMDQPSPRLISTHLFGEQFLPKKLFDQPDEEGDSGLVSNGSHNIVKGKGRLIVAVRNLKDTLVSLHHFRGVPEDGWYGNEHGPGSFRRWIDLEDCHNSYGSAFHWVKASADAVDAIGPERALVVYYEALQSNFAAQLRRINDFLGMPRLSAAKERAITHACSAKTMRKTSSSIIRKGVVRDWTNYLDDERWDEVDKTFNTVLNGVKLAEPLRFYQLKEVPGMPPPF
ncbi:hypothetical protein ACHAXT_011280 [Thalassiosira profunda]